MTTGNKVEPTFKPIEEDNLDRGLRILGRIIACHLIAKRQIPIDSAMSDSVMDSPRERS